LGVEVLGKVEEKVESRSLDDEKAKEKRNEK